MIGAMIQGTVAAYMAYQQRQEAKKNRRQQKKYQRRQRLSFRMAEARRAGIHPLAALGVNVEAPPYPIQGDYSGIKQMGQSAADIANKWKSAEDRELFALALRQEKAKTDVLEYEADILLGRKKRRGTVAVDNFGVLVDGQTDSGSMIAEPGIGGQPGTNLIPSEQPMQSHFGIAGPAVQPLHNWNSREDGTVGLSLTKDMQEAMEEDLRFKYGEYTYSVRSFYNGFVAKGGKKEDWNRYWRKRLPKLPRNLKWEYQRWSGRWKKVENRLPVHKRRRRPRFEPKYRGYDPKFDYGPGTP